MWHFPMCPKGLIHINASEQFFSGLIAYSMYLLEYF